MPLVAAIGHVTALILRVTRLRKNKGHFPDFTSAAMGATSHIYDLSPHAVAGRREAWQFVDS